MKDIRGRQIPVMSWSEVENTFGEVSGDLTGREWIVALLVERWERCGVMFQSRYYGYQTIEQSVQKRFGQGDWTDRLSEALVQTGRQKNFLVACSTVAQAPDFENVCLVGSKAMEGGEAWRSLFEIWVSLRTSSQHVDIHYVDPGERTMYRENDYVYGDYKLKISSHEESRKIVREETYDIVIDDTYSIVEGVEKIPWVARYWSVKDHSGQRRPFVHSYEARRFSHFEYEKLQSAICPCQKCSIIDRISRSYGEMDFLHCAMAELGSHCSFLSYSHRASDLRTKGRMLRDLLATGVLTPTRGQEYRSVISLVDYGISFREGKFVLERDAHLQLSAQDIGHERIKFQEYSQAEDVPYLNGKRVMFAGVDPIILGGTRIHRVVMCKGLDMSTDVHVFASTMDLAVQHSGAHYYWLPMDALFPNYLQTGRRCKHFFEYVMDMDKKTMSNVFLPGTPSKRRQIGLNFRLDVLGIDCRLWAYPKGQLRVPDMIEYHELSYSPAFIHPYLDTSSVRARCKYRWDSHLMRYVTSSKTESSDFMIIERDSRCVVDLTSVHHCSWCRVKYDKGGPPICKSCFKKGFNCRYKDYLFILK